MPSLAVEPQPWILSRRDDLVWFQGSVVAGLGLLAFFLVAPHLDDASYTLGHPAVLAVFLWGVLFDGTHVWGTYARTYFAPDEASRAGLPGGWSFGFGEWPRSSTNLRKGLRFRSPSIPRAWAPHSW